ncbi:MAG TPA: VWA domain-containing protein [Solirubrobacteraceae bacterium]|nr:VWA domain-containing protein [Solirubrobacteraceae bacterium]
MSFQAPALLLTLLALPVAAAVYWRRQARAPRDAVRFPGVATLDAVLPPRAAWARHLPALLFALALAGLLVALARPQRSVAVPTRQSSVVLVTDTSRSMLAEDVDPSRLEAARAAAHRFLNRVPPRTRVGLVAFSQIPTTVIPPTDDLEEVHKQLDGLAADGATATGDALAAALRMLRGPGDARSSGAAIVLLSDGKRTTGRDPVAVAAEARRLRVPIYTVALGTEGASVVVPGTSVVIPVPPDPATMRVIARTSGGRFFAAHDAGRLSTIYERLGTRLGTRTERRQVTSAFAAGGALLLLAAAAASLWRFGRLP